MVRSETPVERLELALDLPDGLVAETTRTFGCSASQPGEERELEYVSAAALGRYQLVGGLGMRAHSTASACSSSSRRARRRRPLRVYPRGGALREIVRPHETQPYVGNIVARAKVKGIEFADLRPYVPRRPGPPRELARDARGAAS